MIIFVPKETKNHEYRVALVPSGIAELVASGHEVLVQASAGEGSGIADESYVSAGARLLSNAEEGYQKAQLVVKVKEPQPHEYPWLRRGQLLFCYLHLAAELHVTEALMKSGATALAFETIVDDAGRLPLLIPMSEVAGRMSVQQAAKYLENPLGGRGVLLGGVPGTPPAHVTILGGGVVGTEAAKMAAGLGARVHLLDKNVARLRVLSEILPANVVPLYSDRAQIVSELRVADVVIGAVLVKGARAPRLVSRKDLQLMQPGSVVVDVAVDQGGCFESTRPTSHQEPTYVESGVVHYCVPNIPGAVSRTSTFALSQVIQPYVELLANHGFEGAGKIWPHFLTALNVEDGKIRDAAVAQALGLPLG